MYDVFVLFTFCFQFRDFLRQHIFYRDKTKRSIDAHVFLPLHDVTSLMLKVLLKLWYEILIENHLFSKVNNVRVVHLYTKCQFKIKIFDLDFFDLFLYVYDMRWFLYGNHNSLRSISWKKISWRKTHSVPRETEVTSRLKVNW